MFDIKQQTKIVYTAIDGTECGSVEEATIHSARHTLSKLPQGDAQLQPFIKEATGILDVNFSASQHATVKKVIDILTEVFKATPVAPQRRSRRSKQEFEILEHPLVYKQTTPPVIENSKIVTHKPTVVNIKPVVSGISREPIDHTDDINYTSEEIKPPLTAMLNSDALKHFEATSCDVADELIETALPDVTTNVTTTRPADVPLFANKQANSKLPPLPGVTKLPGKPVSAFSL